MDVIRKRELWLYAAVWGLVFALVPLVLFFSVLSGTDEQFAWRDILPLWGGILPFLLLFVLHNHLAAPFLERKRIGPYLAVTLTLLVVSAVYCFFSGNRPPEMAGGGPPPPPGGPFGMEEDFRPAPPDGRRPVTPEVLKIIMGVLVVVTNLGVKAVFRNYRNEQKLQELKAQSLGQQLETLRYQINPHFFMNTLNNIHALVDIDPDKAKESIEVFSKLMRIVLYEGNAPTISISRETEYPGHYVSLMRLRYPESVDIILDVQEDMPEAQVPPLLLASFAENAFKHGVSYEEKSFIHISVAVRDGTVCFKCVNSRHPAKADAEHGLGLDNVRKRLDLLYGARYSLDIEETANVYDVRLRMPAREDVL
jgi:hypothetical protein